jgi:hypothetical protein
MPAGMETALSLLPSQGDSSLTCAEYKSKAKFSYFGAYAMTTLFLFCLSAIMESRKCKKDGFHVGAEVWRVNDGAGDRDGAIGNVSAVTAAARSCTSRTSTTPTPTGAPTRTRRSTCSGTTERAGGTTHQI